jgi:Flp pilus assembly protein TadG
MVEFALILPVLAFLLIGLVEVGRYASFSVRVSNAARAGAEFAAIRPSVTAYDSGDITNAACADAGLTCTASATENAMQVTSSVTCTYSDGTADSTCALPAKNSGLQRKMYVNVSVRASFTPLIRYPLLPSSVPMSAATTVQVDQGQ